MPGLSDPLADRSLGLGGGGWWWGRWCRRLRAGAVCWGCRLAWRMHQKGVARFPVGTKSTKYLGSDHSRWLDVEEVDSAFHHEGCPASVMKILHSKALIAPLLLNDRIWIVSWRRKTATLLVILHWKAGSAGSGESQGRHWCCRRWGPSRRRSSGLHLPERVAQARQVRLMAAFASAR